MRLFVFDVDQTILPLGLTELPDKEIEALNALLKQGDAVAIASGRNFMGIKQYLDVLASGKKFAISSNGSGVFSYEGDVLASESLPLETLFHFHDELGNDKELVIYAYTSDDGIIHYGRHNFIDWEYNVNHMKNNWDLLKGERPEGEPKLFKVMVAAETEEASKRVVFSKEDKEKYSIVRSDPHYLEVMPKGIDKSTGVDNLRKVLGIDKEDVYCFGDADNDLGMIASFNGIAMGNATEACKKAARFVTVDCKNDGVYHALKSILKAI